ncbi:MAG TPA: hypothetical protein VJR04_16325 [Terriglobales bacterium]|nr:hypothetical protein [Terriglobales bacterium]
MKLKFSCLLFRNAIFLSSVILSSALALAQNNWAVQNTFHIGGEGGWDYVTFDPQTRHLYVPRSTHTLVIDAESGKTLADIPGQRRNHGVALDHKTGRGFITDGGGDGAVVIFDLKTNQVLGTIKAQPDADGIIFDPASGLVLLVSGDGGTLLSLKPDIDPKTGQIDPPIELGGKPEFLASDGKGKIYVNLVDKSQVAVVDIKSRKVLDHWSVAPGGNPVGMSMDTNKRRLFIGCRNPQKLIVMDANDGKVLADLPISAGVDATKFDGAQIFASCRDGKLYIASETSPGHFEIAETVQTPEGARTMDVDRSEHKAYLPTAQLEAAQPGSRPRAKPDSFMIVVVGRT